ncbi:hypothetical protein [Eubacterium sp.]|uniref:hypothetical protein n=1 Tax=Eubacterium sp. TaxID=142586 RepID=UPI003520BDEF
MVGSNAWQHIQMEQQQQSTSHLTFKILGYKKDTLEIAGVPKAKKKADRTIKTDNKSDKKTSEEQSKEEA